MSARGERAERLLRQFYPERADAMFAALDQVTSTPEEREAKLIATLPEMAESDLEQPQEGERLAVRERRNPERGRAMLEALARLDEPDAEQPVPDALGAAVALFVAGIEKPAAPTPAATPPAAAPVPSAVEAEPVPVPTRRAATPAEQDQRLAHWLHRILDDITPALPPMVALGYLHCWRLADWRTGEFYVSHERMAERLGVRSRHSGKKILRTLVAAGVVTIRVKGKEGQATSYRLAPLSAFNRERVIAAVVSTWMGLNPKMLAQATGHQRARTPDDGSPESPYPPEDES